MNKNLYGKEVWRVDSTVLIVDIFFELTNTVFVNSTNISTNIVFARAAIRTTQQYISSWKYILFSWKYILLSWKYILLCWKEQSFVLNNNIPTPGTARGGCVVLVRQVTYL